MKDLGGWLDSVLIRTAAAIRLTARQAGSQFIGTAALFSIQNAAASTMSDFDRRHPKFQHSIDNMSASDTSARVFGLIS